MKKSKLITIGLLALSVAACHKKQRQTVDEWNQNNIQYYVNDGSGFHHNGLSPFWIYYMYNLNSYNRVISSPSYMYRSPGRYGSYHTTSFGERSSMSSHSISRGGFGHSSSHAGS